MGITHILNTLIKAVVAGMAVVRADQGKPTVTELKTADMTHVTPTDRRSEAAMLSVLSGIPNVDIWTEESAASGNKRRRLILGDPMDGTSATAMGLMSATVIAGVYDRKKKQVLTVVVGEPVSGRLWFAETNTPAHQLWFNQSGEEVSRDLVKPQWDRNETLDDTRTVFLDVSHGFKEVLSHDQMRKLMAMLSRQSRILIPGSNGLIQAVVANGAKIISGAISTAKGGPWDLVGGLLVKQAGGSLRGFRKIDGKIIPHDPLDVLGCDILVSANSEPIAEELAGMILAL